MTDDDDQDSALRRSRAVREGRAADPEFAGPLELAPGVSDPQPQPAGARDARPRHLLPASPDLSADPATPGAPPADDAAGQGVPPTGGPAGPEAPTTRRVKRSGRGVSTADRCRRMTTMSYGRTRAP